MATQDLEKLVVQLSLDLRAYERAMAKAQGVTVSQMRKIEVTTQRSANRIETNLASLGRTFAKGLIAGSIIQSIRKIGDASLDVINKTARMGDVADRIGITVEQMQALSDAAVTADLDIGDLEKGLLRFVKATSDASRGQGELGKLFRGRPFKGQDAFADLETLADLLANTTEESDKAKIAQAAFGRNFEAWIEVLGDGRTGLEEYIKRLRETQTAIDPDTVQAVQKAQDAFSLWVSDLERWAQSDFLKGFMNTKKEIEGIGAAFDAVRKKLSFLPGIGTPEPIVSSGQLDLEKIRPAPGAGTRPAPPIPRPRPVPTHIVSDEELARMEREKELREDLIQTVIEYDEERSKAFADSVQQTAEQTRQMELEGETLSMTTEQREAYLKQQELINLAIEKGLVLTPELLSQIDATASAYGKAAGRLEALQEQQALMTDMQDAFKSSIQSLFSDIAHGVEPVDALTESLKRLADQLLDLALNAAITKLFKTLLTLGGGGGAPGGMGLQAGALYHQGGVVGGGAVSSRRVSPGVFAGAPRLHSGLGADEFPAILQRGEMVIPRSGGGRGGYGRVVVNNYGGQVEQQQKRGPGGEPELHLWFRAQFQRELASPTTGKSLNANFGLSPLVKRR